jgi:hypothetical protein
MKHPLVQEPVGLPTVIAIYFIILCLVYFIFYGAAIYINLGVCEWGTPGQGCSSKIQKKLKLAVTKLHLNFATFYFPKELNANLTRAATRNSFLTTTLIFFRDIAVGILK